MKRYLNDTTASAATGVLLVSVVGTVWRSSGGSILVAAAIRTAVEGRSATKTFYAVRWDDPEATPEGPDALPTTATVLERDATLTELKTAIANAEELPCGWTDVSPPHVEPPEVPQTAEDEGGSARAPGPRVGDLGRLEPTPPAVRGRGGGGDREDDGGDDGRSKEREGTAPDACDPWSRGEETRRRVRRSRPCSSRGRGGGGTFGGRVNNGAGNEASETRAKTALLFSETKC